jgi:hypothetical protein
VINDKASAVIEHQTLFMRSRVNDLVDDVRQHRRCLLEGFARLDIRTVIQRVLDANDPVCVQRQLQTTGKLRERPVWVDGDATLLQEILRTSFRMQSATDLKAERSPWTSPSTTMR